MNDEAKPPKDSKPQAEAKPAKEVQGHDPTSAAHAISLIKPAFEEDLFREAVEEHLDALAKKHGLEKYTILYLIDEDDALRSWHSNRLYKEATAAKKAKPILLVLHSLGGSIEDGYLISKTCKRLSNGQFVVAIPRKAKSAATLLSLGADEIHMGLMSQLGPIDPQFNGFPALGMKNALAVLADLACKHPEASKMLGEFLRSKLDLNILGYFERINESATQYAERLLVGKKLPANQTPASLADHFVNHYKDHRFVIDFDEARDLLGDTVIKRETPEYKFSNEVFESLDLICFVLDLMLSKDADLVGVSGNLRVFDKKKSGDAS